jgi:hypothetical protein
VQDIIIQQPEENSEKKVKRLARVKQSMGGKKVLYTVLGLLAALGIFGTVVFYNKYQDVKQNPGQAQKAQNSAETQRVLSELKKVLRVDETEAPTVARVEDPAKLKKANAEFYKNVEKGDYLIVFPKRAVIYREQNNQLINIAPIITTSGTTQSQTPATTNSTSKTTTR